MSRPKLLMLDEPSSARAADRPPTSSAPSASCGRPAFSVLLVEQNARAALAIADCAYVMELGEFVMSGPAAAIRDDQRGWRAISASSTARWGAVGNCVSFTRQARA